MYGVLYPKQDWKQQEKERRISLLASQTQQERYWLSLFMYLNTVRNRSTLVLSYSLMDSFLYPKRLTPHFTQTLADPSPPTVLQKPKASTKPIKETPQTIPKSNTLKTSPKHASTQTHKTQQPILPNQTISVETHKPVPIPNTPQPEYSQTRYFNETPSHDHVFPQPNQGQTSCMDIDLLTLGNRQSTQALGGDSTSSIIPHSNRKSSLPLKTMSNHVETPQNREPDSYSFIQAP